MVYVPTPLAMLPSKEIKETCLDELLPWGAEDEGLSEEYSDEGSEDEEGFAPAPQPFSHRSSRFNSLIAALEVPKDYYWTPLLEVLMWCITQRRVFADAKTMTQFLPYLFYVIWKGGKLPAKVPPSAFFTLCYDVMRSLEGLWDPHSSTAAVFALAHFDASRYGGTCVDLRREAARKGVLSSIVLGVAVAAGLVVEREAKTGKEGSSVGGVDTAAANALSTFPMVTFLAPPGETAVPPHASFREGFSSMRRASAAPNTASPSSRFRGRDADEASGGGSSRKGARKRPGTSALLRSGLLGLLTSHVGRCNWVNTTGTTPLASHAPLLSLWVLELLSMVKEEFVLIKGAVFIFNLFEGCVTRIRTMRTRILDTGAGRQDVSGNDPWECLTTLKGRATSSRPAATAPNPWTHAPRHSAAAPSRPELTPDDIRTPPNPPLDPFKGPPPESLFTPNSLRAAAGDDSSPLFTPTPRRKATEIAIDDYFRDRALATHEAENADAAADPDDASDGGLADTEGPKIFRREMLVAHSARAEGVQLSHRSRNPLIQSLLGTSQQETQTSVPARTATGTVFVDEEWASLEGYLLQDDTAMSYMYACARLCLEMMARMSEQATVLHGRSFVPLELLVKELLRVRLRSVRHLIDYLLLALSAFDPYDPSLAAPDSAPPQDLLDAFADFDVPEAALKADLRLCVEKGHHAMAHAVWRAGHDLWGWPSSVLESHRVHMAAVVARLQLLSGIVLAGCAAHVPEVFCPPSGRTKVGGEHYPMIPLHEGLLHVLTNHACDTVTFVGALAGYVQVRTGGYHQPHARHEDGRRDVALSAAVADTLVRAAGDVSSVRFSCLAAAVCYVDDTDVLARFAEQEALFKPLVLYFQKTRRKAPPGTRGHVVLFPSAFQPSGILFKEPVLGALEALRRALRGVGSSGSAWSANPLRGAPAAQRAPARGVAESVTGSVKGWLRSLTRMKDRMATPQAPTHTPAGPSQPSGDRPGYTTDTASAALEEFAFPSPHGEGVDQQQGSSASVVPPSVDLPSEAPPRHAATALAEFTFPRAGSTASVVECDVPSDMLAGSDPEGSDNVNPLDALWADEPSEAPLPAPAEAAPTPRMIQSPVPNAYRNGFTPTAVPSTSPSWR
eukprot:TRINITY_DN24994_c0_g1_i1.p1 TRINITY_DN24994_c0_g1~~TRINITY_DN24994_c0_g1_i1.p1  ORF type:complete len:1200 (+),score=365.63 TRINITY_DN24994_c0_g1_i1:217-3600(+)